VEEDVKRQISKFFEFENWAFKKKVFSGDKLIYRLVSWFFQLYKDLNSGEWSKSLARQPFSKIGSVPLADELIDVAFGRASKVMADLPRTLPPLTKARRRETARMKEAGQTFVEKLTKIVKEFPILNEIHPFYYELADVTVDVGSLKKSLAALNWAANMISSLSSRNLNKVRWVANTSDAAYLRRSAYGRMVSVIFQIKKDLNFLKEASAKLRDLPSIETKLVTIVVAGYPNVGKSTFVKQVSTAKPKIDNYPFTTKEIIVGYRETDFGRCQIIDTPGLLDRPLSERNRLELQAIIALKHLAHTIIFMADPSETCGYPLNYQLNLYHEVSKEFAGIPFVKVLNKADLVDSSTIEKAKTALADHVFAAIAKEAIGVQEAFKEALTLALSKFKNVTQ
jgi:nucleolar GTP-binding protein